MLILTLTWNSLYTLFTPAERVLILQNKKLGNTQESFARTILPEGLFQALFITKKDSHPTKASINRVFTGDTTAKNRFEQARNYIVNMINPDNGCEYGYSEGPYWTETLRTWTDILTRLSSTYPDSYERYHNSVRQLIFSEIHPKNDSLEMQERLNSLLERSPDGLAAVLTTLTLMASTLPYWNDQSNVYNQQLYDLILDSSGETVGSDEPQKRAKLKEKNAAIARENIEKARLAFHQSSHSKEDAKKCCTLALSILQLRPLVNSEILGEAAFIIYKCSQSGEYPLPKGSSPMQYLEMSNRYGYPAAAREWKKLAVSTLIHTETPASETTAGTCILNAHNSRSDQLDRTKPENWETVYICEQENILLAKYIQPGKTIRCYFFHENEEINLANTLQVLQLIKESTQPGLWNLEIYLKAENEVISTLIDTAISHLDGLVIPVHILNEPKRNAQRLLTRHPLYYPIRDLPKDLDAALHFIVIGDGLSASWLIREAFWRMSFQNPRITTEITLIAEQATSLLNRIYAECPGMQTRNDSVGVSTGISMAKITAIDTPLHSCLLREKIQKIIRGQNTPGQKPNRQGKKLQETGYYFAIATPSDEENLSLAMHLRQWMIQGAIADGEYETLENLPVIAYQCQDPDMSHLSKSIVAQLESLGNRWYNNYALIPFGALTDYSFNNINHDIYEEIAWCKHLYSGHVSIKPADRYKDEYTFTEVMDSYYNRQYNKDSCYSVATSMPYQLYQCNSSEHPTLPPHWSILDDSVFTSPDSLDSLAEQFRNHQRLTTHDARKEENIHLARWEHERWIRWMCTRGWMPATPDQAAAYIKAQKTEDPRHQLYLAKLHPCMCPFDKLKELEDKLKTECQLDKHFVDLDLNNVTMIPEYLRREWLRDKN